MFRVILVGEIRCSGGQFARQKCGVGMQTKPQPPPGVALSTLLTIRGREAAHGWLRDALGAAVPLETIRKAASARQIPCVKRGRALYFSTQGLFDWFAANYNLPALETTPAQQERWFETA